MARVAAVLERLFRLRQHDTTPRREALGGATTFATMAYIIVVNPAVLSFAGIPVGPSTVATVLTIVMMVFTYNIGNGLTAGLIVHPVVKAAAGRFREVKPGAVVLALLCATYYVFGLPH